jgi:hypothetical protein
MKMGGESTPVPVYWGCVFWVVFWVVSLFGGFLRLLLGRVCY